MPNRDKLAKIVDTTNKVVKVSATKSIIVPETTVKYAVLGVTGPQGPQGEQGPIGPAGSGAFTLFTTLTDTPSAYAGYGGYYVQVNQDEDALIFSEVTAGDATLRAEVESISADHEARISTLENASGGGSGSTAILIGTDGIEVVESPSDTWTISVSADYALTTALSDYHLQVDAAAVSAGIDTRLSVIEGDYSTGAETNAASANALVHSNAYTDIQIAGIEEEATELIGDGGIQVVESPTNTWTVSVSADYALSSEVDAASANALVHALAADFSGDYDDLTNTPDLSVYHLEVDAASISAGLDTRLSVIEGDYSTTAETNAASANALVHSNAYTDIQIAAIEEEATIIIGDGGIEVVQDPTNTWTVSVSADYALSSEVDAASANAVVHSNAYTDTQIAAIADTTILLGEGGIQVVESPDDTWTISVSADYALSSEVDAASANALVHANAYTDENLPDLSDYHLEVDAAAISAGLDSRITVIEDDYVTSVNNFTGAITIQDGSDGIVSVGSAGNVITVDYVGTKPMTIRNQDGSGTQIYGDIELVAIDGIILTPSGTEDGVLTIGFSGADTSGVSTLQSITGDLSLVTRTGNFFVFEADQGTGEIEVGYNLAGLWKVNGADITAGHSFSLRDSSNIEWTLVSPGLWEAEYTGAAGVDSLNTLTGTLEIVDGPSILITEPTSTQIKASLDGDAASPGNKYYYGTNGSGTKGFYSLQTETNAASANALVQAQAYADALEGVIEGVAIFQDKTGSTNGGTFTQGAWRTRALNTTIYNDITGCSLGSSQVTIPAGKFIIRTWAQGFQCNRHYSQIIRISGGTVTAGTLPTFGTASYAGGVVNAMTLSHAETYIEVDGSTVIELQHFCETTSTNLGFGYGYSAADSVYSAMTVIKVK